MERIQKQIILAKNDYELIKAYLKRNLGWPKFNKQDAEDLQSEIKNAKLLHADDMPADVVRINSTVTIREEKEKKEIQLTVVTPDDADIKQRKISILSPVGAALLGFRKGQVTSWKAPAGKKVFTILDVSNNF